MESYSKSQLPQEILPPDYSILTDWWDYWPEARPEFLDFWGRGNFTRRLMSRNISNSSSCFVRVEYVGEIESALRRLALLDIEVDFAWCGSTYGPMLTMLPQDIDYEDSGGWGYIVAAGDRFKEKRGGREWCPSLAWSLLLPDTVTDWLFSNAYQFIKSGKAIVCPVGNIGIHRNIGHLSEEHLQKISNSASIIREASKIETLFSIEIPYLEDMSIPDIYKFCQDHKDSLVLFQNALNKLINSSIEADNLDIIYELTAQIKEGVAELRLSDKANRARKLITTLGASISTFLVTVGVQVGVDLGTAALGSIGAAMATLAFWAQSLEAQNRMRKNPYYIIWALQKGKQTRNFRRKRTYLKKFSIPSSPKNKEIPPHHWLTPPTGGWVVPSAYRL